MSLEALRTISFLSLILMFVLISRTGIVSDEELACLEDAER
jgi:hypothetical protein